MANFVIGIIFIALFFLCFPSKDIILMSTLGVVGILNIILGIASGRENTHKDDTHFER